MQDAIVEGDEDFAGILTLTGSVPGIRLGARDTAIATIQDDDSKSFFISETCYNRWLLLVRIL